MIKWYLFAIFIFGLLFVLILLYSKFVKNRYPDVSEYKQREERLFKLYQNLEDLMDSFEEYVEEVKVNLLEEINQKKNEFKEDPKAPKVDVIIPEADVKDVLKNEPKNVKSRGKSNVKSGKPGDEDKGHSLSARVDMINELFKEGMSVDDIARELDIGKGEIKLILQLNNKKTKV